MALGFTSRGNKTGRPQHKNLEREAEHRPIIGDLARFMQTQE